MANEKVDELPPSLKRANIMLAGSHPFINPFSMAGVIQYSVNCFRASRVKTFPPVKKIAIKNFLTGESCAHIEERLMKYSVSPTCWSLGPFANDGGILSLHFEMLVPARQAWMADVILRWFEGTTYIVETPPIICPKRGSSAEYAANSAPWTPKGSRPHNRSFSDSIVRMMFSALYGQSKFSAQVQREIEKMRADKGKDGAVSKLKAKPATKPVKRKSKKKPESKLVKFFKS